MSKATVADVYIIESLDPDDEGNGRLEGVFLSHVLRLHGKNPKYKYVRTRDGFEKAVLAFGKSNYRYLHLSFALRLQSDRGQRAQGVSDPEEQEERRSAGSRDC